MNLFYCLPLFYLFLLNLSWISNAQTSNIILELSTQSSDEIVEDLDLKTSSDNLITTITSILNDHIDNNGKEENLEIEDSNKEDILISENQNLNTTNDYLISSNNDKSNSSSNSLIISSSSESINSTPVFFSSSSIETILSSSTDLNQNDNNASQNDKSTANSNKNKISFDECVALGNENCNDGKEEEEKEEENEKPLDNTGFYIQSSIENKTALYNEDNLQEENSKQIWNELPTKLGLPFILILFILFIIVLILFLAFLIQDSFFKKNTNTKETIKVKTGYGTHNLKLNQLQLIEQRINAAKLDCDLDEVHVQKTLNDNNQVNNRLSDEQNNNVPKNEQQFEEIALQRKSISHM